MPIDRKAERQLAELYRVAQERLGLAAALETIRGWQSLEKTAPAGMNWYADTLVLARKLRRISKRMARRYLRLSRAIAIGITVPDPEAAQQPSAIQLGQLWTELAQSFNEAAEATSIELNRNVIRAVEPGDAGPAGADTPIARNHEIDDALDDLEGWLTRNFTSLVPEQGTPDWDLAVPVEENWEWPEDEDEEASLEELQKLIGEYVDDAGKQVDKELNDKDAAPRDALGRAEKRMEIQALKAAAESDQAILRSGRRFLAEATMRDSRRVAYMRVTDGNPCAFCAMLASRGAVYTSALTAEGLAGSYHPNCACTTIALYVDDPFYTDRDQYFIDNWPKATKGYSGKNALKRFRQWLTQQYREGKVPDGDPF